MTGISARILRPSLTTQLLGAALVVAVLIGGQAVLTRILTTSSVARMEEAQEIGVDAALLGERIKLDVVQVQQWLTDISATRGLDGLNDGFDVAAEYAVDFQVATEELETLRPELATELADLRDV